MFSYKKSLGQNFLIDKNIVKKIIKLISIKNENIVEIGPGNGFLTDEIIKQEPKTLMLIEKDDILSQKLKKKYKNQKKIEIFNSDILKFNIEKKIKKKSIIFGNLPYNISSQILIKFLKFKEWPPNYTSLIFMFQKELGDKIMSTFPSSNYGRISIIRSYRLNIISKFLVKANSFYPKPKVKSLVIHFMPKNKNLIKIKNINNLEKVTNIIFSNKRKMINKSLKKLINIKKIPFSLNLNRRPSDIKPEIYYKITNIFEKI